MPALVNSASAAPSPRRSTCQLAGAKQLWFADLHDQTILSPRGIGFWEQIYQHRIPGSRILYQKHAHDYSKLVNYPILPYFTTNLTQLDDSWGADLLQNRLTIPLTDQVAQQKFYACFLRENQRRLTSLIQQFQDQWSKVDWGWKIARGSIWHLDYYIGQPPSIRCDSECLGVVSFI